MDHDTLQDLADRCEADAFAIIQSHYRAKDNKVPAYSGHAPPAALPYLELAQRLREAAQRAD